LKRGKKQAKIIRRKQKTINFEKRRGKKSILESFLQFVSVRYGFFKQNDVIDFTRSISSESAATSGNSRCLVSRPGRQIREFFKKESVGRRIFEVSCRTAEANT